MVPRDFAAQFADVQEHRKPRLLVWTPKERRMINGFKLQNEPKRHHVTYFEGAVAVPSLRVTSKNYWHSPWAL